MKHIIGIAAAAVALAAGAVSAHAGCAYNGKLNPGLLHKMPGFMVPNMHPPVSSTSAPSGNAAQNIVGTWLVTYTSAGSPFGQALIQWHDDGTEWENINFPPSGGNICLGSWKALDPLHVTRLHYGWIFTNDSLTGYFTETETDRVPHRGAYEGVNDTKIFDLNGNVLAEVPGTASAVRIAP